MPDNGRKKGKGDNMTNNENKVTNKKVIGNGQVMSSKTKMRTKEITSISLMGALSFVLMLFKFPLPFMPPFMDFDFAGVVEIMGGLMFGPLAAFYIIVVKILLKLVIMGTSSAGTGELQNVLLSCAYVIPAVLIYMRNKTKKTARIGMGVGTAAATVVAVLTNLYLIIPFYATLFGMTMDDIVAMCTAVNPAMKDAATMVVLGIIPFNLIKYGVSSLVALVLYKHLSRALKSFIQH